MRGSVRREVVIGVGADDRLGRGRAGPSCCTTGSPASSTAGVDGDQRTVTLGTGLTLDETILTNDPLQRRFQYRIAGGLFAEHLASLDVIALADDRCLVTYATDADPATMAIVLGGAMAAALGELRRQLEGRHRRSDALEPRRPRPALMGRKILFVTTDQQRYDTLGCNGRHARPARRSSTAWPPRASATSGPSPSRWCACRRARRCSPASTPAPTACG